jgi:glucose-1-phosphate adenylyltransferase
MDRNRIIAIVLGGGRGTRLLPLTKYRSKPAVPVAGKYRIIDIPLSNCINSGMNRIYVLTQFMSVSLHRHIRRTYNFDAFGEGFVEILAAQQTNEKEIWYQGTADAVRQHLRYIQQPGIDHVLILSGDQLYHMNYNDMLETHKRCGADVTIAALPVDRKKASAFGIMRLDDSGRVHGFLEKPKTEEELKLVRTDPAWIDARGIKSNGRDCLASMGIYLFNRDLLVDLLSKTNYADFGKEVFPTSIRTKKVFVHMFDGYWEDIGTIQSFFEANLELARSNPPFDLTSVDMPIYTRSRSLAPARIEGATVRSSLIADGCRIEEGAVIENSVIGLRTTIGKNVKIRNAVIMGHDFYEEPGDVAAHAKNGCPPMGIGEGTVIERAIVDKNARIGRNVRIVNTQEVRDRPDDGIAAICDGITVVVKDAVLPDNWKLM